MYLIFKYIKSAKGSTIKKCKGLGTYITRDVHQRLSLSGVVLYNIFPLVGIVKQTRVFSQWEIRTKYLTISGGCHACSHGCRNSS